MRIKKGAEERERERENEEEKRKHKHTKKATSNKSECTLEKSAGYGRDLSTSVQYKCANNLIASFTLQLKQRNEQRKIVHMCV